MSSDTDDDFNVSDARKMVLSMNRKKKKSGGFQAMGLSPGVLKGIYKKGYKLPTPIQRKSIPLILSGRDVVAMARTGSGKTAAFLIPLFERLKSRLTTGPRALILSPTRELAIQTLKFIKEIGKFTGLTAAAIFGGDKMEEQFSALHSNPDIIIATPGRLMHIIVEMNLKLRTIEMVIFDEGDRLFELGFADQLSETLLRLPRNRQTLMFSATLPSNLIEFTRAGLTDPILIRLDVDTKLSANLKLSHISCLSDQKNAILFHLIKKIIPSKQHVVVFFATKHHVEFFTELLTELGITCVAVHSGLDQTARTLAMKQFRGSSTRLLLVTDVAARGLDIPHLDNVINYHFPSQPKLFLHRVGRVARAGRLGAAYSLIDPDELPYLFDLFVFLGKNLQTTDSQSLNEFLGRAPRSLTSESGNLVDRLMSSNANLISLNKVCEHSMKRYIKTRPKAASESVRRGKHLRSIHQSILVHPIFPDQEDDQDTDILNTIHGMKLPTIFEALGRQSNPAAYDMMTQKRRLHDKIIARHSSKQEQCKVSFESKASLQNRASNHTASVTSAVNDDERDLRDTDFFIPYQRSNEATERAFSISNPSSTHFNAEATAASLDLLGDDGSQGVGSLRPAGSKSRKKVWDRRRKRYVDSEAAEGKANLKRIKTESGIWIPASYKTDKYKRWLKQTNADQNIQPEERETTLTDGDQNTSIGASFYTRYGNVTEFLDDDGKKSDQKRHYRKGERAQTSISNKTESNAHEAGREQRRKVTKEQLTVVGTKPWTHGALVNQKKRAQRALEKPKIRQPKGSRTFGQVRRPEQVLRQRRLRDKRQRATNKKGNQKSGKSKQNMNTKKSFLSNRHRK